MKQNNDMQTNDYHLVGIVTLNHTIGYRLLILDKNTQNHTIVYKLFVLDGST